MRFVRHSPIPFFHIICSFFVITASSEPPENDILLDKGYRVKWHVNGEEIVFEVDVEAMGLVVFGISKSGEEKGSDIVTGWVNNGTGYFQDRHGVGNSMPKVDTKQDWKLLNSSEVGNRTILKFSRRLQTCDSDDLEITGNALRLIWAYTDVDPLSPDALDYPFPNRGSKRLKLLQTAVPDTETSGDDVKYWDAMMTSFKPPNDTKSIHWCKIIERPQLSEQVSGYKQDILLSSSNETFFHHVTLFECNNIEKETGLLQKLSMSEGMKCSSPIMLKLYLKCTNLVAGFAVGGKPILMPRHAGIPLSSRFFLMKAHLENLDSYEGEKPLEVGLRLSLSPKQIRKDYAIVISGIVTFPGTEGFFVIPPGQPSFVLSAHVHPKCFDSLMPPEGMKILGVQLHAHWLGRRIKLRHFRGNVELPPIADDTNYEFDYQEFLILKNEVSYLKGDLLTLECTYDSSKKNQTTYYGSTSDEEMCSAYILYYPKTNVTVCSRYSSHNKQWDVIADKRLNDTSKNSHKTDLKNDTEMTQVEWDDNRVSKVQWEMRDAPQTSGIVISGGYIKLIPDRISYPKKLIKYAKPDTCSDENKAEQMSNGNIRK